MSSFDSLVSRLHQTQLNSAILHRRLTSCVPERLVLSIVVIVVALVATCTSCAHPQRAALHGDARSGEYAPRDPSSLEFKLERTECFGECPVYCVQVFGDGRVSYHGSRHVATEGEQVGQVSPAAIASLLRQCEELRFFDLHDSYVTPPGVMDCPAAIIELRIGDRSKRIENRWAPYFAAECPRAMLKIHESLDALAQAIDRVAATEQWVGYQVLTRREMWPETTAH
jgi:hypothetical protein